MPISYCSSSSERRLQDATTQEPQRWIRTEAVEFFSEASHQFQTVSTEGGAGVARYRPKAPTNHFRYRCTPGRDVTHVQVVITDEPIRFLAISSSGRPDIIVYPDSDKIGVGERLPRGGGLRAFCRRGDRVGYFDGEIDGEKG